MSFRSFRSCGSLAATLALGGCFDLSGLDEVFGAPLLGIAVEGGIVEVGDTLRVTAMGDAGGIIGIFSYDILPDARWTVSNPAIAQLQPLPPPSPEDSFPRARTLVRGLSVGSTQVQASARRVTGEATVRVIPVVRTIQLNSPRDTIAVGDTLRVAAIALDTRGTPIEFVPMTYTASGGLQLRGFDFTGAQLVGTEVGPATVSARFRRSVGEVTIMVLARSAP